MILIILFKLYMPFLFILSSFLLISELGKRLTFHQTTFIIYGYVIIFTYILLHILYILKYICMCIYIYTHIHIYLWVNTYTEKIRNIYIIHTYIVIIYSLGNVQDRIIQIFLKFCQLYNHFGKCSWLVMWSGTPNDGL